MGKRLRNVIFLVVFICGLWVLSQPQLSKHVTYTFENAMMEQEAQDNYVVSVTNFIKKLDKYSRGLPLEELAIYVDDAATTTYKAGEMYINAGEADNFQTFFELMLAINGEACNAGEAYGLAAQVYEESGLGVIEQIYSDEELAVYFSDAEKMYLLDFTLPMLEPYFFEEETAEYVQSASVAFADYCVDEYGMSKAYRLCMDGSEEGHAKLVELKNDWLAEIAATETYEECGKLAFAYNYEREAEDYPYVIREERAHWYFSSTDVKNVGYCTFVKEYGIVAPVSELDFAEAREVLKTYVPEEIAKVDILTQFYNVDNMGTGAVYNRLENIIQTHGDWRQLKYSLLHEYIHYLTVGEGKIFPYNSGLVEGITEEIAVFECENCLQKMFYEELMADEEYGEENYTFAKEIGGINPETNQLEPRAYYYYLAKAYYKVEQTSNEYKSILLGMILKPSNMTLSALSYWEAGRSFSELYEDWGAWNEQRYQELRY